MRVVFIASDKPREQLLADAFLMGAARHGHDIKTVARDEDLPAGAADVVCMVGVKSRELFQQHHRAGAHIIYFDKGYVRSRTTSGPRGWEFWRVSIDAHQPIAHMNEQKAPADRLDRLGLEMQPWRAAGNQVVLAGSSAKYHAFYGLPSPTEYWRKIVRELRITTWRPLVYRPKPSWKDAVPIRKTRYSGPEEGITQVLSGAHAMITHGSNACFESVLAGVPVISLGPSVARPISSTELAKLEAPYLATDKERWQWLANLAYWQWTLAEFSSGEAWDFLSGQIHA